jgi:hypothetical protein
VEDNNRTNEVRQGLALRAKWDEPFKEFSMENPRVALAVYSYSLTDADMTNVMAFHEEIMSVPENERDAYLNNRLAQEAAGNSTEGC